VRPSPPILASISMLTGRGTVSLSSFGLSITHKFLRLLHAFLLWN
jgi:hypothetical protein